MALKHTLISSLLSITLLASAAPAVALDANSPNGLTPAGVSSLSASFGGSPTVEAQVTRGQFISSIIRLSGLNLDHIRFIKAPDVRDVAPDVSPEASFAGDLIVAGHYGVVENGTPFRPDDPVTREEAALIAVKALNARVGSLPVTMQYIIFDDEEKIGKGNMNSIQYACKLGLFEVQKLFRPGDPLTSTDQDKLLLAFKKALNSAADKNGVPWKVGSPGTAFHIGLSTYTKGGIKYRMDASPFIENGRALVPVRYLALALGVPEDSISWSPSSRTVTLTKGETTIVLAAGGGIMYVNDSPVQMDSAPVLRQGRIYLPARYVAEALDCTVEWNEGDQAVLIHNPDQN